MRAPPRSLSCALLAASVGLSGPTTRTASADEHDPRDHEVRDLEVRTRLDLDALWQEYRRSGETRPFAGYLDAKFRRQRDVGRGLLFGGAGLGVVGAGTFFLALPRNDAAAATYASYACLGVAAGLMIAGAVVWRRNFRRLESLESAGLALGPRLRLRSAGPVALRRGAGVGFDLAF